MAGLCGLPRPQGSTLLSGHILPSIATCPHPVASLNYACEVLRRSSPQGAPYGVNWMPKWWMEGAHTYCSPPCVYSNLFMMLHGCNYATINAPPPSPTTARICTEQQSHKAHYLGVQRQPSGNVRNTTPRTSHDVRIAVFQHISRFPKYACLLSRRFDLLIGGNVYRCT